MEGWVKHSHLAMPLQEMAVWKAGRGMGGSVGEGCGLWWEPGIGSSTNRGCQILWGTGCRTWV